MHNSMKVKIKTFYVESWHQACINPDQGREAVASWRAKESTASTDTRDKVGTPDPGMDIFRLRLVPEAHEEEELYRALLCD
jgi:hypothetical protein